jgi:hypothetical protein
MPVPSCGTSLQAPEYTEENIFLPKAARLRCENFSVFDSMKSVNNVTQIAHWAGF